jgi:hypothetical protein
MACVKQWQRRVIEGLAPHAQLLTLPDSEMQFFLGSRRLFPLGISNGIGTCADLANLDVLVLGLAPPGEPRHAAGIGNCRYAVLLRNCTAEEKASAGGVLVNSAVDLLRVTRRSGVSIIFSLTPHKQLYCALV